MLDKELYQQILGIGAPWHVSEVDLDASSQEVRIRVDHPRGTKFQCPECQTDLPCHDHGEERCWRHLDTCQFKTILVARVPRVKCPVHGVKSAPVPWAEKHSRFTISFEKFAIDVLLMTQSVTGGMSILGLKWDQTWNIVERAVARGKARKTDKLLPRIGIDEKAFAKGHIYVTRLFDIDNSTVEAVGPGRDSDAAKACYAELSDRQRESVEAVSMDMSSAYVKATKETFTLAEEKIVHDRFHVMQMMTKAVDQVRRAEQRELLQQGDTSLKGSRYLWLTAEEKMTRQQRVRFDQIYNTSLKTGKAWAFKELFRDLWNHASPRQAKAFFNEWYKRVIHTDLGPIKNVAKTVKERLANVVSYCKHGITNAVAEGINSKIMAIKRRVGGYRNIRNFITAIFFYCGGLSLHPR